MTESEIDIYSKVHPTLIESKNTILDSQYFKHMGVMHLVHHRMVVKVSNSASCASL